MGKFTTLVSALALAASAASVKFTINTEKGNATSGLFNGIMYEDINNSGDGGLYAELVQNRAFQDPVPNTNFWVAHGVSLSINTHNPLSDALPNVLQVTVAANATGKVGFTNLGYWGFDVNTDQYKASFYIKGDYTGDVTLSLKSEEDGTVFVSKAVPVRAHEDEWKQYTTRFTPSKAAPNANNTYSITLDAEEAAGKTLYFDLISLFPKTWSNSGPNGFRPDLMEPLDELGARFLRFPGGNNLEGHYAPYFWKWNETLGDLKDRVGYPGAWGYTNTMGLGLIEYMRWCDLMHLEPILAVWAGLYLNNYVAPGVWIPEEELGYYVQYALDEIEFLTGDASTEWGARRAALGYPKPWVIKYVEVGNEDNLANGLPSYQQYRFRMFYDGIKAKYPNMTIIASTTEIDIPAGAWKDWHRYDKPDMLVTFFNWFDHWNRSNPIFVGELAVIAPNEPNKPDVEWIPGAARLRFPSMIGAAAEAVFMIGCERNADLVKMVAYAPGFQNLNKYQWTPDLISYTADPADTTLSISYYVQKLFGLHQGTTTVPVETTTNFGPLYWSATYNADKREYYVKMTNYNGTATNITVDIPAIRNGHATFTTVTAPDGLSMNEPRHEVSNWTEIAVPKGTDGWTVTLGNLAVGVLTIHK